MTSNSQKKSPPPIVYLAALVLLSVSAIGTRSYLSSSSTEDMSSVQHEDSGKGMSSVQRDDSGNGVSFMRRDDSIDRISEGSKAFFPEDGTQSKADAIAASASGNLSQAQTFLERSLRQKPNDPESVIYRNNFRAAARNPLTIAVSIPVSTDANGSREILRGVAQAQSEINAAGGIEGRPLKVMIASDDNDVETAQQVAHSLVNLPEVLGVVGHYASSVTLATADIYSNGELVAISPISSTVQLSNKSPYVFRTVPSDYISARALTDYMLKTLKRKKAVVYFNSQSDYSKSLKGEFSTAIALQGGQVVAEYDLANSQVSLRSSLTAANQRGAEAIMLASNTSSLDQALQVVQLNNNRLPILGGDDVYTPKTLEIAGEKGRDLVVAVPWHILASGLESFAQRSRKLWAGDVNWRTATAYDATQALGVALQKTQNRAGVQKALRSPNFASSGASQTVSFMPSGDRNAPVQLVKVVENDRSTNGGYGYSFTPIP
jgi:branched-chain amino acid transport system substrate-binding protein